MGRYIVEPSLGGDQSRAAISLDDRFTFMSRYSTVWLDFQEGFVRGNGNAFNVVNRSRRVDRVTATPRFGTAPTYVENAINGLGAIQFADNAAIGLPSGFQAWNISGYTAVCVFNKPATDTGNGQLFGSQLDANGGVATRVLGSADFGDVQAYHQSSAEINYQPGVATITADTDHILTQVYDAAAGLMRVYVDGFQHAELASGADAVPSGAGEALSLGSIGASVQAAAYLGEMAHFSILPYATNRTEYGSMLTDLHSHTADRYGITLATS